MCRPKNRAGDYIVPLDGSPGGRRTEDFSAAERSTLRNVCDTLVPAVDDSSAFAEFYARPASALGVDTQILDLIRSEFPPRQVAEIHQLLRTVESPVLNLFLGNGFVRFSALSGERRTRYLQVWRDSRAARKRTGFQALKRLTCFLFYAIPDASGHSPNWPAVGYPGVFPSTPRPSPDDHLLRPIVPEQDLELSCDVCVVGSGAGGSVAARDLQAAGLSVIVLEAGPYLTGSDLRPSELDGTARSFDRSGTLATDDLAFQLLAGRGAGGGTFVNWMTCLRPPPFVLREWESRYGIDGLSGPEFGRVVDSIWQSLEVNDRESQRNPNNDALWRGCQALGFRSGQDFQTISRNAVGCALRCDYCGFGCAYSCKRSTILNLLPEAQNAGARFLFRTQAEALEVNGGRVDAVRARYSAGPDRSYRVRVRARAVVLAGGAIHTPLLLLRSGVRSRGIGRGLRLHPTTAVAGDLGRSVQAWAGPPQTVAVTKFLDWEHTGEGFWMEAAPAHPGLFALAAPWVDGAAHKRWMQQRYARATATIVLLRDGSRGTVTVDARGEPSIRYALSGADRARLTRGLQETGRILAAAGAKGLITLHSTPVEVEASGERLTESEVDTFLAGVAERSLAPNRCLMFSAHLMGSCPMGRDSAQAAVSPRGAVWGLENAYVADGSVFPTAPGVNPMITVMAMARRTSQSVVEDLRREKR